MGIIITLLVVFAGLMFLAQRRQKKEAQAVTAMQDSLAVGDLVMTTSGLHGTVVDLDEDTVDLEIAEDVVTTWNRLAIRQRVVETVDETLDEDLDDDLDHHLDEDAELDATTDHDGADARDRRDALGGPVDAASRVGPRLTKD